jgi:hypothetical protein
LEQCVREKFEVDENKAIIAVINGSVAIHALISGIQHDSEKK